MIDGELYELTANQDDHVFYVGITTVNTTRHQTHRCSSYMRDSPLDDLKRVLDNKFSFHIVGRGNLKDETQLTLELIKAGHPILNTRVPCASRWYGLGEHGWTRTCHTTSETTIKLLTFNNYFVWMTSEHVITWDNKGNVHRHSPLLFRFQGGPAEDLLMETPTEKRIRWKTAYEEVSSCRKELGWPVPW